MTGVTGSQNSSLVDDERPQTHTQSHTHCKTFKLDTTLRKNRRLFIPLEIRVATTY